jgi:hypothetical protein
MSYVLHSVRVLAISYLFDPIVRQSDKCYISLKVNTITCVIWGQKPNRLLTKERSRTSETRYHRRTNNANLLTKPLPFKTGYITSRD